MSIPVILALTYPHVGRLAGIMGSFGGMFTIYLLPTLAYVTQSGIAVNHPEVLEASMNDKTVINKYSESDSYDARERRDRENSFTTFDLLQKEQDQKVVPDIGNLATGIDDNEDKFQRFKSKKRVDREKRQRTHRLKVLVASIIIAYGIMVCRLQIG